MVRIAGSHPADPGSSPGVGTPFAPLKPYHWHLVQTGHGFIAVIPLLRMFPGYGASQTEQFDISTSQQSSDCLFLGVREETFRKTNVAQVPNILIYVGDITSLRINQLDQHETYSYGWYGVTLVLSENTQCVLSNVCADMSKCQLLKKYFPVSWMQPSV